MTEVATSPKTETTPVARASRFWPAALFGVVWGLGWPAGTFTHPRDHQLPVGDGRGRDPRRAGPPAGHRLTVATESATDHDSSDRRRGGGRAGPDV